MLLKAQGKRDSKFIFFRRVFIVTLLQLMCFSLLFFRLFKLQIIEHFKYKKVAKNNYQATTIILPKRGIITDRLGNVLAENKPNFNLKIKKEHAEGKQRETLEFLSNYIPLTRKEIDKIIEDMDKTLPFIPISIKERLLYNEIFRIEEVMYKMPGVFIEEQSYRFYPQKHVGSHILGYLGYVTKNDREADHSVELTHENYRIGKIGVELAYEQQLRGQVGVKLQELDNIRRIVDEKDLILPKLGEKVELTIDWNLQDFIAKELHGISSACTVMNIHNGEILAMVSSPTYDPNSFTRGLSNSEWIKLSEDPMGSLLNKNIQSTWAPASTFKVAVALAALEEGIISEHDTFLCKGHIEWENGSKTYCWKRSGHGNVNVRQSLAMSCDVFYYEVAQKLGINKLKKYAELLGYGQYLLTGFAEEKQGNIPNRRWKKEKYDKNWNIGDTINASIGQGYVTSTPLQNAVVFARLCNGGYRVFPHVTKKQAFGRNMVDRGVTNFTKLPFNSKNVRIIYEGLNDVVNSDFGTSKKQRLKWNDWQMVGKTGTAQVVRLHESHLSNPENIPWRFRDNALFVGVAPYHSPKWVVSVFIEHGGKDGGGGSSVAAPIAKSIFEKIHELEQTWII